MRAVLRFRNIYIYIYIFIFFFFFFFFFEWISYLDPSDCKTDLLKNWEKQATELSYPSIRVLNYGSMWHSKEKFTQWYF